MKQWDDFQLILAIHEAASIRGAATILGVNHSTVSRRLAHIERNLPAALFEKTPSGYIATAQGGLVVEQAKKMRQLVLASQRELKSFDSELSGDISLSIPEAIGQYLLLDDLVKFSKHYPLINLKVSSSYQFANLDKNEADVVVRGAQNPPAHLVGYRLFPYCLSLYAQKNYYHNTPRKDLQWICMPSPEARPAWIAQTAYADLPLGLQFDDITLRHIALLKGHGICRSACFMADAEPELMRLPNAEVTPVSDLWVLTHPDMRNTPKIAKLMLFLCEALKSKKQLITGS